MGRVVPRYRVRTWLRGHLPGPLSALFPKGSRDCGRHEWYRADERVDHCYHCRVGVRPRGELPGDPPITAAELVERYERAERRRRGRAFARAVRR